MVKWDYKKKGVLHMLSSFFKSLKWCYRKMIVSMESKKEDILHTLYTNSKLSIIFLRIVQICYQQISIIRSYWLNKQSELGSLLKKESQGVSVGIQKH